MDHTRAVVNISAVAAKERFQFPLAAGYGDRFPRLRKRLMALDGNVLANVWDGTWEDATTGQPMMGRGVETWTMRDGMIAEWDAAFNVWERDGGRKSPVM